MMRLWNLSKALLNNRIQGIGLFSRSIDEEIRNETEQYIRDNWSDISLFLVRQPNLRFIRKWKDAIIANFFRRHPKMRNVKNHDAIAEIAASSMISAYTYWMEHPEEVRPADIKPILVKVLNTLTG